MFIRKYGPLVLSSFIGASACFVLTQTDLVSKAHAARHAQCTLIDGDSRADFKGEFDKYVADGWELKSASIATSPKAGLNMWYFAAFCR